MKKLIASIASTAALTAALTLGAAAPAGAHTAGPCNGDNTGRSYATHHITALAKVGGLGNEGHKPGVHKGFSACNPSGK